MTDVRPLRLLFIHPFGIGDVIFSLAAAGALARRGHSVDYLCNERTGELLDLCPAVRKKLIFDRSAIRSDLSRGRCWSVWDRYRRLRADIRREKYDAVLDFSMGREYAFLAWTAGVRVRIGWDYKKRGRWLTRRVPITGFDERSPRDAAMDLAVIADPGTPPAPAYPALSVPEDGETTRWLARVTGGGPYFVLAPGGGESWGKDAHYKRWPARHWSDLALQLRRDTRARIVVLGSDAEADLVHEVVGGRSADADRTSSSAGDGPVSVVGESFGRVASLLAGARALVANDGGILHLANAIGTPVVGLYGPVSETGYGPLPTASLCRTVTEPVPCRPCYRSFRFTGCGHDHRCLTAILPARVADEVRQLLVAES